MFERVRNASVTRAGKPHYADRKDRYVNWPPLQFALRQLQASYSDPRVLAALLAVGAIAGLTGPFGTFEALPIVPRLVYWLAIVAGTWGAGLAGVALIGSLLNERAPLPLRIAAETVGAAIPVTLYVAALSLLFFPRQSQEVLSLPALFLYCLGISLAVITVLETVHGSRKPQTAPQPAAAPVSARPAITKRLPHPQRDAPLTHMSMADHYVEIHTEKGSVLVLMRFADAIAETAGLEGLQVHRSHWVALHAVKGLARSQGRPVVELVSGQTLPVSRSYLPAVRAALGEK